MQHSPKLTLASNSSLAQARWNAYQLAMTVDHGRNALGHIIRQKNTRVFLIPTTKQGDSLADCGSITYGGVHYEHKCTVQNSDNVDEVMKRLEEQFSDSFYTLKLQSEIDKEYEEATTEEAISQLDLEHSYTLAIPDASLDALASGNSTYSHVCVIMTKKHDRNVTLVANPALKYDPEFESHTTQVGDLNFYHGAVGIVAEGGAGKSVLGAALMTTKYGDASHILNMGEPDSMIMGSYELMLIHTLVEATSGRPLVMIDSVRLLIDDMSGAAKEAGLSRGLSKFFTFLNQVGSILQCTVIVVANPSSLKDIAIDSIFHDMKSSQRMAIKVLSVTHKAKAKNISISTEQSVRGNGEDRSSKHVVYTAKIADSTTTEDLAELLGYAVSAHGVGELSESVLSNLNIGSAVVQQERKTSFKSRNPE